MNWWLASPLTVSRHKSSRSQSASPLPIASCMPLPQLTASSYRRIARMVIPVYPVKATKLPGMSLSRLASYSNTEKRLSGLISRVVQTDPRHSDAFVPMSSESFDMEMDSEPELSDTATTDSKRSSSNVDNNPRSHFVGGVDHEVSEAEPYMSLGYEHDQGSNTMSQSRNQSLAQGAQLPQEPSTGSTYSPCKDPVYNARSWWDYGGGHEYRWDCMREHAM